MAIVPYLAMTAAEIRNCPHLPEKIVWMACHFSPYGRGLSNLPTWLPPGSILMVDDITPIRGHDPEIITEQLTECTQALGCTGVLLDFQRPESSEAAELVKHLIQALPCPNAVSEQYGKDLTCPVFLPPLPPAVTLEEYIAPWQGREIWLELALDCDVLTLTEQGCETAAGFPPASDETCFIDEKLLCHYHIETTEKSAGFTLWRTKDDLNRLLEEAADFGITAAVGLYQELQ